MNTHFFNKRHAYVLGIGGLLPFLLLTLACAMFGKSMLDFIVQVQHAYGIAILSFLGGVHWGAAMMSSELSAPQTRRALWWSVVPSLIGWASAAAGSYRFAVLILGFLLAYLMDRRLYPWYPMPPWLIQLRLMLTSVVIACLLLTVLTVIARS